MTERYHKRILIVEDHQILRDALRSTLAEEFEILEAADAAAGYSCFGEYAPDMVILDLSLPDMTGLALLRRICGQNRTVPVLVLSMYAEASLVRKAMGIGARGYVSKRAALDVLIKAVHAVLQGKTFLDATTAGEIGAASVTGRAMDLDDLTARELEVFLELTAGSNVGEIACKLSISRNTVDNHRRNLMEKLSARNTAELCRIAARHRLIPA